MFLIDVGVDLCGDDAGVAEHFLYASEVCSALEQVGSETMTQGVWGDVFVEAGVYGGFSHDSPDFDAVEASTIL